MLLHWIVEFDELSAYAHRGSMESGMAKSSIRKGLELILSHSENFVTETVRPRPAEELQRIGKERLEQLGLKPPCEELESCFYVGDGKHYRVVCPDGKAIRPESTTQAEENRDANRGKWGMEVEIGEETYSKISWKPGTRGKVCCAHQAFYDITELCMGFTPAVWCGAPDNVQVRRFVAEIEQMLVEYKTEDGYLFVGAFDGGHLEAEICRRLHWVVPVPSNVLEGQPETHRVFLDKVH